MRTLELIGLVALAVLCFAWHSAAAPVAADVALTLDAYERCALERALQEAGGDAHRAARLLGVGRSTLYRKLSKHGLTPHKPGPGGRNGVE